MQKRKKASLEITPIRVQMDENRRHYELFQIAIRFIYLGMASFGFVYWLFSMLNLEVTIMLIFLVSGLSTSWFFLVFGSKIQLAVTLPLSLVSSGLVIFLKWDILKNGTTMVLQRISQQMLEYYGKGFPVAETENLTTDLDLVCCIFTFFVVMLLAYGILYRQTMSVIYILSLVLLCASLAVNSFPDMTAFWLWVCACLGIHATGSREKGKTLSYLQGQAGMVMFFCSCAILIASYFFVVPRITDVFLTNHEKAVEFHKQMEEAILPLEYGEEESKSSQKESDEMENQPDENGETSEGGMDNGEIPDSKPVGKQTPTPEPTATPEPEPTEVPDSALMEEEEQQPNETTGGMEDSNVWKQEQTSAKRKIIILRIVLGILITTLILFLFWLRRYFILRRRKKLFCSKVKKRAIVFISHETYRMLRSVGYSQKKNVPDEEYGNIIQAAFPIFEDGGFQKFVQVVQRTEFSQYLPTEHDLKFCWYIYRKLEQELGGRGNLLRKLWWKYLKCYTFL